MNLTHLSIGIMFIAIGVLTYLLRNTPNPYIGVRFGYTYLSKEAWRKANTFAAIYCISFGILLIAISVIQISDLAFTLITILGIVPMVVVTYRIAKESYEIEDIRTSVGEAEPLEKIDVKIHLILQIVPIFIFIFLTFAYWKLLPNKFAIHFNFYGNPDRFTDKISGTLIAIAGMCIVPIITALTTKDPMLLKLPVYGKSQRVALTFLTLMQLFIFSTMLAVLLYNAGLLTLGLWFSTAIFVFIAFLFAYILRLKIKNF